MSTPVEERKTFDLSESKFRQNSSDDDTFVNDPNGNDKHRLKVDTALPEDDDRIHSMPTPSAHREQATRLEDDLLLLQAERVASRSTQGEHKDGEQGLGRTRSRHTDPVDEFDDATNPLHEKAAVYKPPEKPATKLAALVKKIHHSSFIVRYFTYIVPVVLILLIPLLIGALKFRSAAVGGVELMWFAIWLEIVWLTLWAGRVGVHRDLVLQCEW